MLTYFHVFHVENIIWRVILTPTQLLKSTWPLLSWNTAITIVSCVITWSTTHVLTLTYKHTTHLTRPPTRVTTAITITMHRHITHMCQLKRAKPQGSTQPNTLHVPPALDWNKLAHSREHHTTTSSCTAYNALRLRGVSKMILTSFNLHPRQGVG